MMVFLNDDLFGNMLSTNVEDILSGPFLSTIIMMFLLLILVILMPYAALIPMPTIAAILFMVAYNMSN